MEKILTAIVILFSLAISGQKNDSNEIYSSIINDYKNFKTIVVSETTSIGHSGTSNYKLDVLRKEFKDLKEETLENFKKNNTSSKKLGTKNFQTRKKLILLNDSEKKMIFSNDEDGWETFYNKYPKSQGFLTLSNIGFDNSKTQAIVYYGNQSHELSGIGHLAYFKKSNNKWKLIALYELWIS